MRKMISVLLLVLTILISLSFSGIHSSLEGMTEDRVIDSSMEESGSPAPAPYIEGFQEDNMHEEYTSVNAKNDEMVTKIPLRDPTHSVGVFQRIFNMTPQSESFFIQHP